MKGNPENEFDVHEEVEGAERHHPKSCEQKGQLVNIGHNTVRFGQVEKTVEFWCSREGKLPREQDEVHEDRNFKNDGQN